MFRAIYRMFDYSGRSTRWEYWSVFIGLAVLACLAGIGLGAAQDAGQQLGGLSEDQEALLGLGLLVVVLLPNLALRVRRFHDFGCGRDGPCC